MTPESFKNHVAKYEKHSEHLETLEFKVPGTQNLAMFFVRQHGTLMVFGDLSEATYQWHPGKMETLRWMSGLDEDYFMSKCMASPYGRDPKTYDSIDAERDLREYFYEFRDSNYDKNDEEHARRDKEFERFEEALGWYALEDEFEWVAWLRENAEEVFGADWWDSGFFAGVGKRLDNHIEAHRIGLQAAFVQLKEKEKEEDSDGQ